MTGIITKPIGTVDVWPKKQLSPRESLHSKPTLSDSIVNMIELSNKTILMLSARGNVTQWMNNKLISTFSIGRYSYIMNPFLVQVDDDSFVSLGLEKDSFRRLCLSNGDLLNTYTGHENDVKCVIKLNKLSNTENSQRLVSCSDDYTIKLWDCYLKNGSNCIKTFRGHSNKVTSICELANGTLASGSHNGKIKLWNVSSGECIRTITGPLYIQQMVELSSGITACWCGQEQWSISLWNTNEGVCFKNICNKELIETKATSIIRLNDGTLAVGCVDGTIRIYNIRGDCLFFLQAQEERGTRPLLQLNNGLLASSSFCGVFLWQIPSSLLELCCVVISNNFPAEEIHNRLPRELVEHCGLLLVGPVEPQEDPKATKQFPLRTKQCCVS